MSCAKRWELRGKIISLISYIACAYFSVWTFWTSFSFCSKCHFIHWTENQYKLSNVKHGYFFVGLENGLFSLRFFPHPPPHLLLLKQSQHKSNFMEICSNHRGFLQAKTKTPRGKDRASGTLQLLLRNDFLLTFIFVFKYFQNISSSHLIVIFFFLYHLLLFQMRHGGTSLSASRDSVCLLLLLNELECQPWLRVAFLDNQDLGRVGAGEVVLRVRTLAAQGCRHEYRSLAPMYEARHSCACYEERR